MCIARWQISLGDPTLHLLPMERATFVILDGLQDPSHARDLSARWARAGFENEVDISGQSAAIAGPAEITVEDVQRAAAIARAFGVELRDRAGESFKPDNDLALLRDRMKLEYRGRFAQSLVFGLPALVVHYLESILASGGGQSASSLAFPWFLQMVLVGWAIWVAALPILWQGVWSLIHLRPTADLLTTFIISLAFVPSAYGVMSLLFTGDPWFGVAVPAVRGHGFTQGGPAFHLAIMAVMLATCQRWRMYACIESLAGRANYMMSRFALLCAIWSLVMFVLLFVQGWYAAICFGLLLPPLLSSGGINRVSPGWSMALPVLAFAPVFVLGSRVLPMATHAETMKFEIASGFGGLMVVVMMMGWRGMRRVK